MLKTTENIKGGPKIQITHIMPIPRTRENLKAVKNNAKIVIPTGTELVNIIGELAGIIPLSRK
ncbi:MAG: hypothetical protein NTZ85_03855 [Bacteroidia bacterium]|nr:hypothetical protein [Bacteroidia bacterium]